MQTRKKDMNEVIKTNRLNTVIQNLSLVELRLIQLAIVDSREKQQGLTADKPLFISAQRYADCFNVESHTAYEVLKGIEKTLFDRRFTFINERQNEVKSRWISQVEYHRGGGGISIIFTPAVVREITRIDGYETAFTRFLLEQTASLNSVYSVRLYELLKQWLEAKKASFELELLRGQLGLGVNDYVRMSDFKKRVLDLAVNEINEKTDLKVSYTNSKEGRKIVGFNFKILEKPKKDTTPDSNSKRDPDTPDMFHKMTDKQIETFGAKLSGDSAFGSKYARAGESTREFEQRVKNELRNLENQQKWANDLKRVGFAPQRKKD